MNDARQATRQHVWPYLAPFIHLHEVGSGNDGLPRSAPAAPWRTPPGQYLARLHLPLARRLWSNSPVADQPTEQPKAEAPKTISLKKFFEETPPNVLVDVLYWVTETHGGGAFVSHEINLPVLALHCVTDECDGVRFFDPTNATYAKREETREHFVTYRCRNCGKTEKTYAFWSHLAKDEIKGQLEKFGEVPPFGPHTPARVITLIGPDRDYYLKGRRAESLGMGIAAFAYYRRVVENQKARIFDEIIRAASKLGAAKEMLADLELAKKETRFSTAVEAVKHGIPEALLIGGNNPLTLLHSALSEGLHAQSDEDCLELAKSIRVVLSDLAERMASALKESAELNAAVSKLMSIKKPAGKTPPEPA